MQLWQHPAGGMQITVGGLHSHVMHLHGRFLERLDAAGHPSVNTQTLVPPCDPSCRSHTLVFAQDHASTAKHTVDALARQGIQVDCRKAFVRVGFGANHSMSDVDALLSALKAAGSAGSA
jgi:selenocysteine lyase/cysteine desulfurase